MIVIPQSSDEWIKARVGCATASRVSDIIAKTKSGFSTSRANYLAELIAERLTGEPAASYTNSAMAWGVEKEPDARMAYEFRTDAEVGPAGFVLHPIIARSGASPDGFVGDDGLVEIKCPLTATHIDTLLGQAVPSKYLTQMQFQMACTGCKWVDFISFDPRLPESMRLFISRVQRDDAMIKNLETEVAAFLAELDEKVAALNARYAPRERAAA
jgi:putative phage-type endonuclease